MGAAFMILALASALVVAGQTKDGRKQIDQIGPAIERGVDRATDGRFDPKNYPRRR